MNEQQIAAVKQGIEALESCTTWNLTREQFDRNVTAITAMKHILADQALDKMAENARELGLDYDSTGKQSLHVEHQPAEPDYKVLWQQMCERCDELDKKLAATDRQAEILSDALSQLSKQQPADQVAEPRNMVEQQPVDGLESAHIRLQKRYAELEAKVGQPVAWVGLTAEDQKILADSAASNNWNDWQMMDATEAKLREKNGGGV